MGPRLGLAQYDQPVISRIWSLDHPIEIKEGMVFALETQHGKPFQWGVRIEEMLIVHKDSVEIVSNFPVEQITVVDPMPGYSDYGKRPGNVSTVRSRMLIFPHAPRGHRRQVVSVPRRRIWRVWARRACRLPAASASTRKLIARRSGRWVWRRMRAAFSRRWRARKPAGMR